MGGCVEVQTAELACAALDWAVAVVEGVSVALCPPAYGNGWRVRYELLHSQAKYSPSTEWAQAGPIIEQNDVGVGPVRGGWAAHLGHADEPTDWHHATEPLVAICRAVVAHKHGPTVKIPKELI